MSDHGIAFVRIFCVARRSPSTGNPACYTSPILRRGPVLRSLLLYIPLLWTIPAFGQSPDLPEPNSAEAITAATTDPHYVSPLVSYIPQSAGVPSPEKFFGRIMGAPGELVDT